MFKQIISAEFKIDIYWMSHNEKSIHWKQKEATTPKRATICQRVDNFHSLRTWMGHLIDDNIRTRYTHTPKIERKEQRKRESHRYDILCTWAAFCDVWVNSENVLAFDAMSLAFDWHARMGLIKIVCIISYLDGIDRMRQIHWNAGLQCENIYKYIYLRQFVSHSLKYCCTYRYQWE